MPTFTTRLIGLEDLLAGFDQRTVRTGLSRGLNKLAKQVRTAGKKRITKRYAIKAGRVAKELRVADRATPHQLVAVVKARGQRVGLIRYRARWDARKAGASAVVIRGRGRKIYPHTFIRTARHTKLSGQEYSTEQVWIREGRKRLPIKRVTGPSIPQLFGSKASTAELGRFARRKFNPVVMHELVYAINSKSKRTRARATRLAARR